MVGECPISDLSNQKWRRKSSFPMYYVVYEKKQHFFICRILGEFFATGQTESLNAQMVRLGYAWAYDGGTKHKDFTQLLEKRTKIL